MFIMQVEEQDYKEAKRILMLLRLRTPITEIKQNFLMISEEAKEAFMLNFSRKLEELQEQVDSTLFSYNQVKGCAVSTQYIKTRRHNLYREAVKTFERYNSFKMSLNQEPLSIKFNGKLIAIENNGNQILMNYPSKMNMRRLELLGIEYSIDVIETINDTIWEHYNIPVWMKNDNSNN
tara:strand:+ start:590 stop:1123 length:534 start_codon:yes stop_codon:yes gene_type:complete